MALASAPRSVSMSSMAAPIAPSAAPVDSPWMTRAISSSPTPPAVANTTIAATWTARAASSTGRRPT